MRLINTSSYLIEKFDDPSNTPRAGYAILSHTWILKPGKELELGDIRTVGTDVEKANLARSNVKINEACKLAQAQTPPIPLAWIDTICIDQNSSSDKSEAINAMYRYYQDAKICFTHLFDVDGRGMTLTDPNPDPRHPDTDDMKAVRKEFTGARWFKRGWTLQELLAPPQLLFYDKNWNLLGSRNDLCHTISDITGIEPEVLRNAQMIQTCSIAKRMSWAAGRLTRRPEDKAYSLLGIFGVNMPMIYGEGERAFIRLQEEIIRISDDQSLFAWSMPKDPNNSALLARSPDAFAGCRDVTRNTSRTGNFPYSMNNRGIAMQLRLIPWVPNVYIAPINCLRQRNESLQLGLFLKREAEDDKFVRVALDGKSMHRFLPDSPTDERQAVSLHVKRDPGPPIIFSPEAGLQTINGFKVGPNLLKHGEPSGWESVPHSQWDAAKHIVLFTPGHLPSMNIHFEWIHPIGEYHYSPRFMVYLDHTYDLIYEWYGQGAWCYDANQKKEVRMSTKVIDDASVPVDRRGPHTPLKVDRLGSLNVYLKKSRRKARVYYHFTAQRERASTGNSEVWTLDLEIVDNFEGNPWLLEDEKEAGDFSCCSYRGAFPSPEPRFVE